VRTEVRTNPPLSADVQQVLLGLVFGIGLPSAMLLYAMPEPDFKKMSDEDLERLIRF
jgi:hypothetical protein